MYRIGEKGRPPPGDPFVRQRRMKTKHISAEVKLSTGPEASQFGQGPTTSYPTILTVGKDSFSSQVVLEDRSIVKPGAVLEVQFCFLNPKEALEKMTEGTEFSIWEQGTVGKGTVKTIESK